MAGTVAKKARSDWWSRVDQSALEAELDSRLQMANGRQHAMANGRQHASIRFWHMISGIRVFVIWHLSSGICDLPFVIWHLSSGIL
jgi:hypothetical protein